MAPRLFSPWKGKKRQGEPGFLKEAAAYLKQNGLDPGTKGFTFSCKRSGPGEPIKLFPYQQVIAALVRPETPVNRLLVKWRAGGGKTVGMILVLDAYFADPRPKILVFPEKTVEQNFYSEIMQYPSRYREFLDRQLPRVLRHEKSLAKDWACPNARCGNKKGNAGRYSCRKCQTLATMARGAARDLLDLKGARLMNQAGTPGFPGAPLRAMTYNVAGGSTARPGSRQMAVLKRAARLTRASATPYDNTVLICDELHNLLVPAERADLTAKRKQLARWIGAAVNIVFVGMTATPIPDFHRKETLLKQIMRVVRGPSPGVEGFHVNYDSLTPGLFPKTSPSLSSCGCLGRIVPVVLQGVNLAVYLQKQAELTSKTKSGATRAATSSVITNKLQGYCNMSIYYQNHGNATFAKRLETDGPSEASKIVRVVKDIARRPQEKTLILVHRTTGFKALAKALGVLFRQAHVRWAAFYDEDDVQYGGGGARGDGTVHSFKTKAQYLKMKDEYNAFAPPLKYGAERKNEIRVLVADTQKFSEGISFFDVDRIVLLNPPPTYKDYLQQVGRALRACRHSSKDHTVHVDIYVSIINKASAEQLVDLLLKHGRSKKPITTKIPDKTADEVVLTRLEAEKDQVNAFFAQHFERTAIDAGLYQKK